MNSGRVSNSITSCGKLDRESNLKLYLSMKRWFRVIFAIGGGVIKIFDFFYIYIYIVDGVNEGF